MQKKKIIHIHTDKKFLADSARFECGYFENIMIVIGSNTLNESNGIVYFERKQLKEIVDFCKDANLVVLYDLDTDKSRIAVSLPPTVKVAWRFFGYELYSRKQEVYLSNTTKEFAVDKISFVEKIKRALANLKSILKFHTTVEGVFINSIKRMDFMLVLTLEEHEEMLKLFPFLPKAIKLSNKKQNVSASEELEEKLNVLDKTIVLGNNKSVYNNHFDLIEIVKTSKIKNKKMFSLLMNYGTESNYSREVKKRAKEASLNLICDFMTLDEFESFYKKTGALCVNGYRQMAMANLMMGLAKGVKIYMSKKNALYLWFVNEGFKVWTIEDFEVDIESNNMFLDLETAIHNTQVLSNLASKYSHSNFQNRILKELKGS